MSLILFVRQHFKSFFKLYVFVIFLFIFQIILSYFFVYKTSFSQIESHLLTLSDRIIKDLRFDGKTWDTSLYNSDPYTPYPNGSSGFSNPLYILTKEGFIIERSSPIRGLLDTSDFKHLSKFNKPETIHTVTNEWWRILSKPIEKNGLVLGVVVVSYYNPRESETLLIDRKMEENISFILSQIQVKDNKMNVSRLDIRNIHYEFSFEVVDNYNNVLINNGRVPTFIDTSYFAKEVESQQRRIVTDKKTQEQYMVITRIITDIKSEPVGLIIIGESVRSLYTILHNYVLFALFVSLFCIVPLLVYVVHIFRKDVVAILAEKISNIKSIEIKNIYFDKKGSSIQIDGRKYEIPYASNQYYVCDAIFSAPTKKWEYDELLEKLGDIKSDEINGRKIYDAVLAINKKCGFKLIEYKYKVFTFNPLFLSRLSKK